MLELISLDSTIKLDIRYARKDNFVGRPVYKHARAFLQPVAAHALVRASETLRSKSRGLLIFDGYRPFSVTELFWEVVTEAERPYVADPQFGSRHNRGCAVDLSIYDLDSGRASEMPSDFDEFNEKSHPEYAGGTMEQRFERDLLRTVMEREGFTVNPKEWWHFDHRDWEKYPIMDMPFEDL